MTPQYLLQKFIEHGEKMREAQKGYFKSPFGSPEKRTYLSQSKQAEKEFDNLLFNAKQLSK